MSFFIFTRSLPFIVGSIDPVFHSFYLTKGTVRPNFSFVQRSFRGGFEAKASDIFSRVWLTFLNFSVVEFLHSLDFRRCRKQAGW